MAPAIRADCDFADLAAVLTVGETGTGGASAGFWASFFSDSSAFNCDTAV